MSFKTLKKKLGNVESLAKKLEEEKGKFKNPEEEWFWEPTVGKDGNGYSKIRWLPPGEKDFEALGEEAKSWVKVYSYFFKNPDNNSWFIENSRQTMGERDPCAALANFTYKKDDPFLKSINKTIKRNVNWISNVYVYEDKQEPENDGKVFLYKYGAPIFTKLETAIKPKFDDIPPISPFDFDEGHDFVMRVSTKTVPINNKNVKVRDYEDADFTKEPSVFLNEKKQEEIWKQEKSLQYFLDPERFKDFDSLVDRLEFVFDIKMKFNEKQYLVSIENSNGKVYTYSKTKKEENKKDEDEDDDNEDIPFDTDEDDQVESSSSTDDDDEDDDLSFEKLKNL